MLSEEQIASAECAYLSAHAQFIGTGEVWIEGVSDFARAIESAACAERDARIAELERLRSEDLSHALNLAAEIERMTQQLEEARKDADAFTDEQLEAAVKAWFQEKIVPGKFPFHKRMRAAIAAAIKEQT